MLDLDIATAKAELYARAVTTRQYVDYVRSHGIDPWGVMGFAGGTALLPLYDCGSGLFDFAPHLNCPGEPFDGFVAEVLAEDGETTVDLVAWAVSAPNKVFTLLGRVPAVGLAAAGSPSSYYMDKSLVLHRTPLEWMQSGCVGAAIVNPRLAPRWLLDLPGQVAARDDFHARQVFALMSSAIDKAKVVVAVQEQHQPQVIAA